MKQSSRTSKFLFALFALIVIFSDEIFFSFISFMGLEVKSGMKAREAVLIAGVAYLLLVGDIFNRRMSNRNYSQLIVLFVILALYYFTGLSFRTSNGNYNTHLLSYGAMCIPAAYVGMRLARSAENMEIVKLLPFFVVIVAFFISRAAIYTSMRGAILGQDENDVLNYQNASYYLAFSYSYCFYYLFFGSEQTNGKTNRFMKTIMIILLLVCAIGCLVGGGRGAFVYMVAISVYLIYRILKRSGKGHFSYTILLVAGAGVLAFLLTRFDVMESAGFDRVSSLITTDDVREELWKKAMIVFYESPIIGHGLGSIWWTTGFFSHNVIIDLLAETGVVGTVIWLIVAVNATVRLIKTSHVRSLDMFILIILISALVNAMFSGYWTSSPKLFLVFGYVYGLNKQKRLLNEQKKITV